MLYISGIVELNFDVEIQNFHGLHTFRIEAAIRLTAVTIAARFIKYEAMCSISKRTQAIRFG